MKKVYAIVVGLLLLAAPAFAADVDGKWTGTVSTPMGDLPVQYEFKADGTTLTGTTLGFDGGSIPIKNGKVDGDKISFTVTFDFGGMTLDLSYTGVVSPAEIKMTGDFMGMPFEFTVKKGMRLKLVFAVAALAATVALSAQQPGKHPVSGRVYAQTMGVQGAPWLDRRERDSEEDPDLAIRLLRIQKGATVADVGAGSGNITIRLAKQVGPMGKVYANDIQPGMLEILQKNVARAKVANVVPVLGTIDDPKLPAESIDLAIMVDVYHEFSEPQRMLQRLREAIKPGGRLVLLEYRAEDPDVPILREHKMTKAQVKLEVEHEGFKQSRVYDDLPWQHLFVFTRP